MPGMRSLLITLMLIGMAGCDADQTNRLEKQNAELKAEIEKRNAVADYDLQAKCAKDAREWFNANWRNDSDTLMLEYSNHYDKKENKCFAFVEYHYSLRMGSSWTNNMTLWNIYDNVKYATYAESHYISLPNGSVNDTLISCDLLEKKCSNIDEFNSLVRPFLND